MTTSQYSVDLRKKVIEYLEQGHSQKQASEVFNIHRNTISQWWNRHKKEGTIEPKKRPGAKRKVDREKLKQYVDEKPNTTLVQIAEKFGISVRQVGRILKAIKYSYIKKPLAMWKRTKKKEKNTKRS